MKSDGVFFQIKSLDILIHRHIMKDYDKKNFKMPTQIQIMGYIIEHENEEIYQKDLERVLGLRRATVSGVLQTMEKYNLIERITDSQDTRTKKIILKKEAKMKFLQHKNELDNIEKIALKDISEDEIKVFCEIIKKMKNNIEKGGQNV